MELTIITPTYNRSGRLHSLYDSLAAQSVKAFLWLVVDDGSTDDTKAVVEKMRREADFPVRYLYKPNGGKHTALNAGIGLVETALTFIVDSDDTLTPDAVATVLRYHDRYAMEQGLCGYAFLRAFPDGKVNGSLFVPNERMSTYTQVRVNEDDTHADKAEVFYTTCLREFPFPEYPGEKFLGEDIVWLRMARKYRMVHINRAIYIGAYLEDGLSQNRRKHNIQSPTGCMHRAREFMARDIKLKYRIKGVLQYVIYGKFAGQGFVRLVKNSPMPLFTAAWYLPARVLYGRWKRRYG